MPVDEKESRLDVQAFFDDEQNKNSCFGENY
jgi:hypothetical protein